MLIKDPKLQAKLNTALLATDCTDVIGMMEQAVLDSVATGICMNDCCDYTTDVEPDCEGGYCEECNTQSVQSVLVIAGVL